VYDPGKDQKDRLIVAVERIADALEAQGRIREIELMAGPVTLWEQGECNDGDAMALMAKQWHFWKGD
jgi:hypothetical protein